MTIYNPILYFTITNGEIISSVNNHLYKLHILPVYSACSWTILARLYYHIAKLIIKLISHVMVSTYSNIFHKNLPKNVSQIIVFGRKLSLTVAG